jgi:hypothetical protein
LTIGSATAAATMKAGTYDVNTAGSAFSFSESYTQGDGVPAIGSGVDVATGVVADMPALEYRQHNLVVLQVALQERLLRAGVVTLTAGGAGTTATGQFVSEVVIGD